MSHTALEGINQSQRERLFYIDFKLRFLGLVNRPDLVERFDIKAAAATRDLSLYKDLAPKNLIYDTRAKSYRESDSFKPLFRYPGNQALIALLNGFGDDCIANNSTIIHAEAPALLNIPDLDVLAEITKAIHQKRAIRVNYQSLTSGHSTRDIVPHGLVDNGLRWHVRAFDRKRQQFGDFVVNRIAQPKHLEEQIPSSQSQEADRQWNQTIEMHIVPHPTLHYPQTIEMEYGMESGRLVVPTRAALAGYCLRHWGVDSSENHRMRGPEVHLWLQNRQALKDVDNLSIAPGYDLD